MPDRAHLTDKQLDEYEAIAARAAEDLFYVSDCEGSLQVWREKALTHVRRDANGEIDMYSFPSTYKVTDQIIELDLNTWDLGEDATDDQQRQDINDLVESRAALPVLLDTIRRHRDRAGEAESAIAAVRALHVPDENGECRDCGASFDPCPTIAALGEQTTEDLAGPPAEERPDTLPAWLYQRFAVIHGCAPWDQITDDNRTYWEHQARAVRRAVARGGFKAVAPDAASEATSAPLSASPASSVSESTPSPTGAPTAPRRTLTPNEYNAAWHAVEGAAGDEGADPGTVLHAVLARLGIEWQDAAQPTTTPAR